MKSMFIAIESNVVLEIIKLLVLALAQKTFRYSVWF